MHKFFLVFWFFFCAFCFCCYQLWQVSASIFRCSCRRCRHVVVAVDNGSESLTRLKVHWPHKCACLLRPLLIILTHITFFYLRQWSNFCLPSRFVYFVFVFVFRLLCLVPLCFHFCFRFELLSVNVIIIFPVERYVFYNYLIYVMDGGTNQYLIIAIFHLICLIMTNTRIIIAWQFDSIMFLSETSHAIMLRFSWGWKRYKKI